MANKQQLTGIFFLFLQMQALCIPPGMQRRRKDIKDNFIEDPDELHIDKQTVGSTTTVSHPTSTTTPITPAMDSFDDDDLDDDKVSGELMKPAPTSGGINLMSLLRMAGSVFQNSNNNNPYLWNMLNQILGFNQIPFISRRKDVIDNEIKLDESKGVIKLKPEQSHLQKQEIEEDEDTSGSDGESNENEKTDDNASNSSDDDDDDEPPEGDGQGGGILGILAGLSGGEEGQSDLGSLLATISGIVVNLSGDGVDVNALIASGLGLFVGLLSEGEENPGAIIGSYLLTSLDTLTGGGAKNNGAFFGNLVSKLVKGTSAAGDPSEDSSGENGGTPMSDSAGFFVSLLMGLLGDMSKGSSGGSSQPSRRYDQIQQFYRADNNFK